MFAIDLPYNIPIAPVWWVPGLLLICLVIYLILFYFDKNDWFLK